MSELATYRNMHTGKVAKYLRRESVPNHPDPILVHVLLVDGKEDRWNDDLFFMNWRPAPTDRPSDGNPQ